MRLREPTSGNSSSPVVEHLLGFSGDLDCTWGRPDQKIILSLPITSALCSGPLMRPSGRNGLSKIIVYDKTRAWSLFVHGCHHWICHRRSSLRGLDGVRDASRRIPAQELDHPDKGMLASGRVSGVALIFWCRPQCWTETLTD